MKCLLMGALGSSIVVALLLVFDYWLEWRDNGWMDRHDTEGENDG